MKQLTCEMCGSTDLIKQDGVFVCQSCGTKYSVEEAKKMMVEGTVEVTGTVKVDASEKVKNLYALARRANEDCNAEMAAKYYEMISLENPLDWEATFYFNYFKAKQTTLGDLENSIIRFSNSLTSIFEIIKNSNETNKDELIREIILRINDVCKSWAYWSKSHYRKFENVNSSVNDLRNRMFAIADLQKNTADCLQEFFTDKFNDKITLLLKSYVENYLIQDTLPKWAIDITLEYHEKDLIDIENKIKELDPTYIPIINRESIKQNTTPISTEYTQNASNDSNNNSQNIAGEGTSVQQKFAKGNYYGPLIGSALWSFISGLIFFACVDDVTDMFFAILFLSAFFVTPCVLFVNLIINRIKSKNNKTEDQRYNPGKKAIALTVIIVVLVIATSMSIYFINNKSGSIIGTWEYYNDESDTITFTDDGYVFSSLDEENDHFSNTYEIISNDKIKIYFNGDAPDTEIYEYSVKGDTLIFDDFTYKKIE